MDSQSSLSLSVDVDKELQRYEQSNIFNKSNNSVESEMEFPHVEPDGTLKKLAVHETDEDDKKIDSKDDERILNKRALSETMEDYKLETFEKKIMYIFNQVNIDGIDREGSDKDIKALKETFENFGFIVTEERDKTKEQILSALDALGKIDLTNYGCVAVVVLTSIFQDGTLRAKDTDLYTDRDIIKRLKVNVNPTLITKPKIIIIQECRLPQTSDAEIVYQDSGSEMVQYTLPAESDMLIIHSSYSGNAAHDPRDGSWFIQNLCNKINNLAHTDDLESILVWMKRAVAIDRDEDEIEGERMETHKKMPVITSTLIRKLYLKKYTGSGPDTDPSNRDGHFSTPLRGLLERARQQLKEQETEPDAGPHSETWMSSESMDVDHPIVDHLSNGLIFVDN